MQSEPQPHDSSTRLLQRAAALYERGDLGGTEEACRQLLAGGAAQADALHLLGLVAWRRGERERGLDQIKRAIAADRSKGQPHNSLGVMFRELGDVNGAEAAFRTALDLIPDYPAALTNLGNILGETGRLAEAEAVHRRVLKLVPRYPDGHNNLATVLAKQERWEEAIAECRAAIDLRPTMAEFHFNLGNALARAEKWEEAAAAYQSATELAPENADVQRSLGVALYRLRRFEQAVEAHRAAVRLNPERAESWTDLSAALVEIDRSEEALEACQRALELDPSSAEAHLNRGKALNARARFLEAIGAFETALAMRPHYSKAYNNLGVAFSGLSRFADAMSAYEKAIELDSDFVEARWNKGLLHLLLGAYRQGWESYDYGLEMPGGRSRLRFDMYPVWAGSPLEGKRLLVWSEQGVGDQIMFASLFPDLLAQGADCVIEADRRLVPLFARSFPAAGFLARKSVTAEDLGALAIDYQVFMGSLCRWLRPDLESFPERAPFLTADKSVTATIRARYRQRFGERMIVGISWRGGTGAARRARSIPLSELSEILSQPRVGWVSLQYGEHAQELEAVRDALGVEIFHDRAIDPLQDLDAFAAQTAAMDLVISVDNSTVHMAGALNIPVWVMLPKVPDWRWRLGQAYSPWYPSARLFRQSVAGEWKPVACEVAEALATAIRTVAD